MNAELGLRLRYKTLLEDSPTLRRREIADALSISEAAIIDAQLGVKSVRLQAKFGEIIKRLPKLGYVMCLTRNDSVVHERKGIFDNVKIMGPMMGLVITDDRKIDLRIFLSRWKFGFAVTEQTKNGERNSLQFFDATGNAIQKIFLQEESNADEYQNLIDDFQGESQQGEVLYETSVDAPVYAKDDAVDVSGLITDWKGMTDVHQLMAIMKKHNVGREQILRLIGNEHAREFEQNKLETMLQQAAETKLSIMCFVGNHGNIQIHTGPVSNIKNVGPWLNVLDEEFNLHLLMPTIVKAWLVKKSTVDGFVTSLEFYDKSDTLVVQFFGERAEGQVENAEWRTLAESMAA